MILATSVVPVGVSAQGAAEECATKFPSNADAQEKCYQDAKKAQQTTPQKVSNGDYSLSLASFIIDGAAQFIGGFLQRISGFFLLISGLLFDGIINYTVKDMSTNLGTESGIGGSIQSAWSTLRDISNMVFIFVLLYTAFSYMFNVGSGNIGSNIAWIIVIALVINFSLFFSRVIIDASNVVSLGFYRAIENAGGYTLNLQNNPNATATANTTPQLFSGISGGYMRMLGIHSFWSPNINIGGPVNILMLGIMSAVFVFIVAVILLIASIMFVSRFVILIFIMILSPVAFVMFIIPGMKGKFDEWWKALINQSFFAPVFFGLTWVVFKLGMNENFLNGVREQNVVWGNIVTSPSSITGLIINYFIVIGLSIFALSVSKGMAKSVSQFASVSTAIGTAAIGTAAWAGRTTVGRIGKGFSESSTLQGATKSNSRIIRTGARLGLYASETARDSTFDARNAKIPTNVIGDAIQGTIGRTRVGKFAGLNDVNIPSVAVGDFVKSEDLLGKAGTRGYAETKADSEKRVREREAKETAAYNLAQNKEAINKGANAPAGSTLIDDMEKALAKLSDKETEALIASNRELLKSQNFANAISVKQLEAINKSDQFSDSEKGILKDRRFSEINAAMKTSGVGRTAAISGISKKIKALSDSELEMIDPEYMEDHEFVAGLRPAQIETLTKSGKFTTNQKDKLRTARRKPLADAIVRRNIPDIQKSLKSLGPKEITTLDMAILKLPPMLEAYSSSLLKRMAPEMNPADILELRDEIIRVAATPGSPANVTRLNTWLSTPDGAIFS